MTPAIAKQVDALGDMTLVELQERYGEVFGEQTTSRHKGHLRKRITWGLQAREEGGLSERALRRAEELANEVDLRMLAPGRTVVGHFKPSQDRRLPMPGAVLVREYQGRTVTVTILNDGFEYEGQVFRSLSAVAKAVTGSHWNGLLFFGLTKGGQKR
jgi:hypothetical protein